LICFGSLKGDIDTIGSLGGTLTIYWVVLWGGYASLVWRFC